MQNYLSTLNLNSLTEEADQRLHGFEDVDFDYIVVFVVQVSSGDECIVLDSSSVARWRICSSTGREGLVPAICFHFSPPSPAAADAVSR